MPDIWMDVDIAVASAPVNVMPLVDDTDFKTIEDAVTYNQAGMALFWHFTTTAGVTTVTAVTPTTGDDHDWTDFTTSGMYGIGIPAASGDVNNDTEGVGFFTGVATGILPWRGPTIGFRAAALNNALVDGGDVLDVSLTEIGGVAQSATDLKDFADAGYDPATNKVQGVVLVDTTTENTDMVAAAPSAAAIVNEWESQSQSDPTGFHVNVLEVAGTAQTANDNGADINAVLVDTGEIGAAGAGLTNINLPNQTMDITGNLSGSVGSVTAQVTADVTAISGDTAAADTLEVSCNTINYCTVVGGSDTTVTATISVAVPALIDQADQYNGRQVLFVDGVLQGVQRAITDYSVTTGTATFTVATFPGPPDNPGAGDKFIVF